MPKFSYNPDQFGYYTVGSSFKTYSKLLAIQESRKTGHLSQWHFNPDTYRAYNWTREPDVSIRELYRRRAQEIRDNYDYVVIWYSGGADSWMVLESFLQNDIKIDEIAHWHAVEGDKDPYSKCLNEEVFVTAIPHVQRIREKYPHIKHRSVDMTDLIIQTYHRPEVKFDYIYDMKAVIASNTIGRAYLREYVQDYQDIINRGQKMCFVFGTEKPRMILRDNRYHVLFVDAFSDTLPRIQRMADNGYYDEWFFWGPNCMDLIAKQCHMVRRVLETEGPNSTWLEATPEFHHQPRSRKTGLYLKNDFFHDIIYPGWNPETVVSVKSTNMLIGGRDGWFWNSNLSETLKYAKGSVNDYVEQFGPDWLNDPMDHSKGIKGMINIYALE